MTIHHSLPPLTVTAHYHTYYHHLLSSLTVTTYYPLTGFSPLEPEKGGTFVAHHMVFQTQYVKEMLELMATKTECKDPWPIMIMASSRKFYRFEPVYCMLFEDSSTYLSCFSSLSYFFFSLPNLILKNLDLIQSLSYLISFFFFNPNFIPYLRFSEYKTYATFMLKTHPTEFNYHELSLFGEGGLRFREAGSVLDQILKTSKIVDGG